MDGLMRNFEKKYLDMMATIQIMKALDNNSNKFDEVLEDLEKVKKIMDEYDVNNFKKRLENLFDNINTTNKVVVMPEMKFNDELKSQMRMDNLFSHDEDVFDDFNPNKVVYNDDDVDSFYLQETIQTSQSYQFNPNKIIYNDDNYNSFQEENQGGLTIEMDGVQMDWSTDSDMDCDNE